MRPEVEEGVMVMKDGEAWCVLVKGMNFTQYGWGNPAFAPIHNPRYCKKPSDVTYKGSPYTKELETGELVKVKRTTTVEVMEG